MLLLTQNATAEHIVVTLAEKTTIPGANYLFVFESIQTKNKIRKVFLHADDLSTHQDRYNEWLINTHTVFGDNIGQYNYTAHEQAGTGTDETGLTEVENGKLEVKKETPFEPTGYTTTTNYSGYAG